MSRTLDSLFSAPMPVRQWEPTTDEPLSEGKKAEDAIIYPAIEAVVKGYSVTDIIADEARLTCFLAKDRSAVPRSNMTHLTLSGAFERAARRTAQGCVKAHVTADVDTIAPQSQDTVILNMIMGCMSFEEDQTHCNLSALACLSSSFLKAGGEVILVRPNPEGGAFSTYETTSTRSDLQGGKDYKFIVKGLEDLGEMSNLYTPDDFMHRILAQAGLEMGETQPIGAKTIERAPFLLNVCPKIS